MERVKQRKEQGQGESGRNLLAGTLGQASLSACVEIRGRKGGIALPRDAARENS
jgi:hypothetical protein